MQTIETWCDAPEHNGTRASATSFKIAVNEQGPIGIDLCESCRTALLEPLTKLLEQEGHTVLTPPNLGVALATNQCPYCDRRTPTSAGLAIHKVRMHPDQAPPAKPPVPVLVGVGAQSNAFNCPDCGQVFKSRQAVSGHMAIHRRTA